MVFVAFASAISIAVAVPFWMAGKPSPLRMVAASHGQKPDRIRDWLEQRRAHRDGKPTDKDFDQIQKRDGKVRHFHFEIVEPEQQQLDF
jgi:hypothetical protein